MDAYIHISWYALTTRGSMLMNRWSANSYKFHYAHHNHLKSGSDSTKHSPQCLQCSCDNTQWLSRSWHSPELPSTPSCAPTACTPGCRCCAPPDHHMHVTWSPHACHMTITCMSYGIACMSHDHRMSHSISEACTCQGVIIQGLK